MIMLKKGSDAELSFRTSTMTWDEAVTVLADRPDLLAIQYRLRGFAKRDHLAAISQEWRRQTKQIQMPQTKDVRDMTIRELCDLAEEVQSAPVGTRKMRRAADRMSIAAWHLEGSGALQQMLWWCTGIEPEAPPDGKADVVQMPPR